MKKKIEKLIDSYNEIGNELLDELLISLLSTGKKLIDEKTHMSTISLFIEKKKEHKINLYLKNFDYFLNKNDLLETLKKKDSKDFFLSCIEKIVYLDDSLQIYILSYLTSQYLKYNELNYWETTLYYNINSLSHRDFIEYAKIIETAKFNKEEKNKSSFFEVTNNNSIHIIIKNKFINLGLLLNDNIRYGGNINNFQKSDYSDTLYEIIKDSPFYKDINQL